MKHAYFDQIKKDGTIEQYDALSKVATKLPTIE